MRYFNIFSSILITKGAQRILISDLQRNASELQSLELYEIIEELKAQSIEDIIQNYDNESQKIFYKYLDFLLEKEYGFITHDNWDKDFLPLSYEFNDYNILSNIFIELKDIAVLHKIKKSIESIEIKHLVIFSKKHLTLHEFLEIDDIFKNTLLEGIEVLSPFHNYINKSFIQNLNENTARIYNLIFYSCNKIPFKVKDEFRFTLHFSNHNLNISSCGKISLDYFSTNFPKVLEAINHNSCLHKKIGIDIEGNIRNCPAMPKSFGNIRETSLEEALNHKDFKEYWNLTKDKIEVCKDCEFRYICTDCRAYTEHTHTNSDDLDISKPLKCGYNPYTGEWEEWSTNPLKQKAIKYYNLETINTSELQ